MSDRTDNADSPQGHISTFNTVTASSALSSDRSSTMSVSPALAVPEPSAKPSTLQLLLAVRQAAEEAQAAAAAAAAASRTDAATRRLAGNAPLKLPYLREPNKEANPSDLDIAIRLGAFLARGNDESFLRLLQKEFPEPSMMPGRVQDNPLSRLDSSWSAPTATVGRGPGRCKDGVTAPFVRQQRRHGFVDRHDSDSWSSVEMYLHFQQRIKDDLAFNPQSFTKAQPLNGGPKLQKLLAVHPSLRTSTHIKKIMAIIRVHRGFSDFPVHIQIQLCRCLQYELYEARRLLLRQGHRPTAFYLLLTGSLMVNIQDTHPVTGQTFIRTVSDLKQGDCFGELALLEQTTRTATIICKTQTELASISKEVRGQEFLCTCDEACVRLRSDRSVSTLEAKRPEYSLLPGWNGHRQKRPRVCLHPVRQIWQVSTNQQLQQLRHRQNTDGGRLARGPKGVPALRGDDNGNPALPRADQIPVVSSGTHPETRAARDGVEMDLLEEVLNRHSLETANQATRDLGVRVKEAPAPPPRPPLKKSRTLTNLYDRLQQEWRHKWTTAGDPALQFTHSFWGEHLKGPVMRTSRSGPGGIRRDVCPVHQVKRLDFLRLDTDGYAQIAELGAGDVFGLETLVRRKCPRVSVVSEGAEVIFISKKLFLQEANIRVLRIVNDMMIHYPSATDIHEQLEDQRKWSRFKHAQVQRVLTRAGRRKDTPLCVRSSS
ncbi:hypothetical protein C0Q70_06165 [Pomacea canaliculata]|uniref:Cyclic nucleotide-binding domain-containing protein n=1 Tax=Pomacea canaliculata TaxID=400727 RepID=A0A2T7PN87_POMCA|nr:hypothetical protein C0Q70_06165 [Pomacea canaliculata]